MVVPHFAMMGQNWIGFLGTLAVARNTATLSPWICFEHHIKVCTLVVIESPCHSRKWLRSWLMSWIVDCILLVKFNIFVCCWGVHWWLVWCIYCDPILWHPYFLSASTMISLSLFCRACSAEFWRGERLIHDFLCWNLLCWFENWCLNFARASSIFLFAMGGSRRGILCRVFYWSATHC